MINNLAIDLAHKVQRVPVNKKAIPEDFPMLVVHGKHEAHYAQVLTHKSLQVLSKDNALAPTTRFTFTPDELPQIEQALFEQSRYWAPQTGDDTDHNKAESEDARPWAASVKEIQRVKDKNIMLLVQRTEAAGEINMGWYTVSKTGWQPKYHLNHEGPNVNTYTLPTSLLITAILWFLHRRRLKRIAQRKTSKATPASRATLDVGAHPRIEHD